MITYCGGDKPSSPEQGNQHFKQYMDCISSLGGAVISPVYSITNSRAVNSNGPVAEGSTTSLSGFTIIEVDSMGIVLEITRACPFLDVSGFLEVLKSVVLPGEKANLLVELASVVSA